MKARTMVYLEPEQLEALREEARRLRISLAELIRRLVGQHLYQSAGPSSVTPEARLKIVAMGSSGRADVSENHDRYLAEELWREVDG